jgi:iron complex outermembrane receptor protein
MKLIELKPCTEESPTYWILLSVIIFLVVWAGLLPAQVQAQDDSSKIEETTLTSDTVTDSGPQELDGGIPEAAIEEVYITGSLLPRGNFESNAPITTITSDQFEISNAINIEQLLNTMPQILTGADRTSTFGLGWATADLRGLGTNRTLTLMDGHRIVPTFADGGTVDLNLIPPGLVERVEILTGGASTTYGSDAMAGVINIITKEDFLGFELTAAGEQTSEFSDAEIGNVGATLGFEFGDGRGHFMMHGDYTERKEVRYPDREFARFWNSDVYDASGTPIGYEPWYNIGSVNTAVADPFVNWYGHFNADGQLQPLDPTTYGFVTPNHFDLQVPQEREILFSKVKWSGDSFEVFGQVHASNVESTRPMPPPPVFDMFFMPIQGNPFLSPQDQAIIGTMPGAQFLGQDFDGDGIANIGPVGIGRWFLDLGETQWQVENEMLQVNLGFSLDLTPSWGIAGNVSHGSIDYDALIGPGVVMANFEQAIMVDPFDPTGNSCWDPSNGCVPYNVFGYGRSSQEALDFISTDVYRKNKSELSVASLVLTGNTSDFFSMPGDVGPVGVALGVEYLERTSSYDTDERVANGEVQLYSWGDNAPLDEVSIDRTSVFFELLIPLLEGLPGISFMELEVGGRFTEHSTIGNTSSYKMALSWYVTDDLQLRTSFNESMRAPSIEEMYGDFGEDSLSPRWDADPCSADAILYNEIGYLGGGWVVGTPEQCMAQGVPESALYSDALNISNLPPIPVYSGGSTELDAETAQTFTVGFVWTPYAFEGFSASVDYFSIEVEDYIDQLNENPLYGCFGYQNWEPYGDDSLASVYCDGIERGADGVLSSINAGLRNLAVHKVEGIDISLSHQMDLLGGVLNLNYVASYIEEKSYGVAGTSEYVDCVGKANVPLGGEACSRPVMNLKSRATAGWTKDWFSAQLTWRHLSDIEDGDDNTDYYREYISSYDYFELSASADIGDHIKIMVGAKNLFEKDPPQWGWNSWEANTFPNVYDVFGRTVYARLKYTY